MIPARAAARLGYHSKMCHKRYASRCLWVLLTFGLFLGPGCSSQDGLAAELIADLPLARNDSHRGLKPGDYDLMGFHGFSPYFMHVIGGYVLLRRDAPDGWGDDPLNTLKEDFAELRLDGFDTAYKEARLDLLPDWLRALRGVRLHLLDDQGTVLCEASVERLLLIGQAETRTNWATWSEDEEFGAPTPKPVTTRPEILEAIWEEARLNHSRYSIATPVTPLSGSCNSATWARVAIGHIPPVTQAVPASAEWREAALQQLHKLPIYAEASERLDKEISERALDGNSKKSLRVETDVATMRHPVTGAMLLSASLRMDFPCCESDPFEIWGFWQVSGPPDRAEFVWINDPEESAYVHPVAAVDVNDDGWLEIFTRDGLLSASPEHPKVFNQSNYFTVVKDLFPCGDGDVNTYNKKDLMEEVAEAVLSHRPGTPRN